MPLAGVSEGGSVIDGGGGGGGGVLLLGGECAETSQERHNMYEQVPDRRTRTSSWPTNPDAGD